MAALNKPRRTLSCSTRCCCACCCCCSLLLLCPILVVAVAVVVLVALSAACCCFFFGAAAACHKLFEVTKLAPSNDERKPEKGEQGEEEVEAGCSAPVASEEKQNGA